jgi:ATP/maltotriose-dependent transcriptional regulator MalT
MVESIASSRTVATTRLPIPADPLLARDHLVARLRQLPAAGVALVVSPVGFGATSLLAMAAREHAGPLIWLSARAAVGDGATEFWRRLAAELQDAGAPFVSAPAGTPPSHQPQVLEPAGAAPMGEPDVLLVLDDVPRDDTLDGRLQRLLDELPNAVRVWVSTRTEPPWDTAGWVASGRLLVLDRPALTLSSEESDEYVLALAPALAPTPPQPQGSARARPRVTESAPGSRLRGTRVGSGTFRGTSPLWGGVVRVRLAGAVSGLPRWCGAG